MTGPTPEITQDALDLADQIKAYDRVCEANQESDICHLWDLLHDAADMLRRLVGSQS